MKALVTISKQGVTQQLAYDIEDHVFICETTLDSNTDAFMYLAIESDNLTVGYADNGFTITNIEYQS